MTLHPIRLRAEHPPSADDIPSPTVGFVLYAGWHPDAASTDLVQAVTEVAEALRELARDALPAAESVTAVAVSPAAGTQAARIEQVRRAVLELAGTQDPVLARATAEEPPRPRPVEPIASASGLRIDRTERRVTVGGDEITLTRLEFDLLAHLAANPRRVFTRTELMRQVWQFAYPNGSRTVDAHVRRLRSKLGAEAQRLETVRGVGYRWVASRRERLLVDTFGPAA